MNIDLNSFDREKAIDETVGTEAVDLELSYARLAGPIRIEAKAKKTAAGVGIAGRLTGAIEMDCGRCLEPIERPVDIELDLEFASKQVLSADANVELHPDDMKLDAIEGSAIDLAEIAREQILLDLPQQFFCKANCKGLCETCASNLNLKDCDCKNEEIDPRWAALKNLN